MFIKEIHIEQSLSSTQSQQGFGLRPQCLLLLHALLSPPQLPEGEVNEENSLVKTGRFVILDAHPTGKAVLHLHCLYHGTLLAVTDLDKVVIEIGPHFPLSLFKMQLSPDHRQRL